MSVIITVIAAFAAVVAISKWQGQSAYALGKVSAVISVTSAFAEAWSKTQDISKRLASDPTRVALPSVRTEAPSTAVVRREPEPAEDSFYSENPSFRTGGIRGYNAYAPLP
jgi:hypothetical protein